MLLVVVLCQMELKDTGAFKGRLRFLTRRYSKFLECRLKHDMMA